MRFHLEASDPEEIRKKSPQFLRELAKAFSSVAPDLAESLEKALPEKTDNLSYPVLQEISTITQDIYSDLMDRMLADIMRVVLRSTKEVSGVLEKADGENPIYYGPHGGKWADPEHTVSWKEHKGVHHAMFAPSSPEEHAAPVQKRRWIEHKEGLPKETIDLHRVTLPEGNFYRPERKEMHDRIITDTFKGKRPTPEGKDKTAIVMMGAPASGKTTAARKLLESELDSLVNISADDIKEGMPEYQEARDGRDPDGTPVSAKDAAGMAHAESGDIAAEIYHRAIDGGYSLVLDGTGKNIEKHRASIAFLQKHGYKVVMIMPHLDVETGMQRGQERAEKTGRLVKESIVRDAYKTVPGNFEAAARLADEFHLFSTKEHGKTKHIWSGGKGQKDQIHHKDLFEDFQKEAHASRIHQGRPGKHEDLPHPNVEQSPLTPLRYLGMKKSQGEAEEGKPKKKTTPYVTGERIAEILQSSGYLSLVREEAKEARYDRDVGIVAMPDDFNLEEMKPLRYLPASKEAPVQKSEPLVKFQDFTGPVMAQQNETYDRVKRILITKHGCKAADFEENGRFYGWSANELLDAILEGHDFQKSTTPIGGITPGGYKKIGQGEYRKVGQGSPEHHAPAQEEAPKRKPKQVTEDWETPKDLAGHVDLARKVLAMHHEALPATVDKMKAIVGNRGIVQARVKDLDSAVEKVSRKPDQYKHVGTLTDTMGSRVIHETLQDVFATVGELQKQFPVVEVEDHITKPLGGYRSIHMLLQGPTGLTFEVQVRTKNQHTYAEWAHHLYKPENQGQKDTAKHPEVLQYSTNLAEYFADLDQHGVSMRKPNCTSLIQQTYGCAQLGGQSNG